MVRGPSGHARYVPRLVFHPRDVSPAAPRTGERYPSLGHGAGEGSIPARHIHIYIGGKLRNIA